MNRAIKKCCICNNEKTGEFILIGENKYHLICIEKLSEKNRQLEENNLAMQEEMAKTWAKLDKKEDIICKIREILVDFMCEEYYCSQGIELYQFCENALKTLDSQKCLVRNSEVLINYLRKQIDECKSTGNDEDYVRVDVYKEILHIINEEDI